MLKAIASSICAALLLWATCHAAEAADRAVSPPMSSTSGTTPPPDFESLRIKGINISLPGPEDTIDPDYAGIRSSLAALGIGYIGYSNNNFWHNLLPHEQSTFGEQTYNGQKPTFLTNNVMQMTYDLSRYGIPDGQVVVGGIAVYDTWEPAGPNALSLATLTYYQTLFNKQVELKFGYLNNLIEFWGPFLAGTLSASIFGPSSAIPVELGFNHYAWTTPGINIKINGPEGFYNKMGIQRASNPDGPFAEKTANPSGFEWSTPNSGVLVINEVGYRKQAAPGQPATWVRASPLFSSSRYIDYATGGRSTGNYGAYFLADHQFVQLAPVDGQAARGVYAGVTAMYAPPEFNRFSQFYELRAYGIGLLPSRPRDLLSLVIARNVFSHYQVEDALQSGQLAHSGSLSITVAYSGPIAPGIRAGIGLGYTDHPSPVIYTPQTGSALNLLANVITYW